MGKLSNALLTATGIKPAVALLRRDAGLARAMIDSTLSAAGGGRREDARPDGAAGFEEAVRQQGLSEADLDGRYLELCVEAWAFGCLALIMGMLLVHFLISASWAGSLSAFGLTPAFAAFALRSSFRAWQLRQQRFGRLQEWLRQPGAWWPRAGMSR